MKEIHVLIHATKLETIQFNLLFVPLQKKALEKLNQYRLNVRNQRILRE